MRGPARRETYLDRGIKVTALCGPCHRWLTLHPDWAVRHGHQVAHEGTDRDEALERAWHVRAGTLGLCDRTCPLDHILQGPPPHL